MTPFVIDIGIGDTLEAINGILVRVHTERGEMRTTCRSSRSCLACRRDLDRMYFAVLAEIENVFAQPAGPRAHRVRHRSGNNLLYRRKAYPTSRRMAGHN